jgi:hypothetical protein
MEYIIVAVAVAVVAFVAWKKLQKKSTSPVTGGGAGGGKDSGTHAQH